MLSKLAKNFNRQQALFKTAQRAAGSSKPSIGDAVTILQSKVSSINQVVSDLWSNNW